MTKYYIYKYYGNLIKETYVFKDIIPYIKMGYIVKAKNKYRLQWHCNMAKAKVQMTLGYESYS